MTMVDFPEECMLYVSRSTPSEQSWGQMVGNNKAYGQFTGNVKLINELKLKFGIPIDGPMNVYCDNKAVTKNAIYPESTLKKIHNSIAYYRVHEAVAAGTI